MTDNHAYDPHHNGYTFKRFLEGPTPTPADWYNVVASGEIVLFRDRLIELLELESRVKGQGEGW